MAPSECAHMTDYLQSYLVLEVTVNSLKPTLLSTYSRILPSEIPVKGPLSAWLKAMASGPMAFGGSWSRLTGTPP